MILITEIVNEIPQILQYFVSGSIFLWVFYFLNSKNMGRHNTYSSIVLAVVCSFLIISTIRLFDTAIMPQYNLLLWAEVLIASVIAIVAAFLVYKIQNSVCFSIVLNKMAKKSANDNLWRDAIDFDKGTTMKIFLANKSVVYIGKLVAIEENGNESWLLLTEYTCLYLDSDEEFNSTTCQYPSMTMIPLKQIERTELYYSSKTKIFDRWQIGDKQCSS